ncbi:MAG: hypothetical protein V3T80_00085 [Kiloniellales bacterium]
MPDGTGGSAPPKAEETFAGLRHEFLEDASEEIRNLLSFLHEAVNGNRPAGEVLVEARRVAVMLSGGASGYELPLVGVAAQRFDDYIASMTESSPPALSDLAAYAETLLDLLAEPDGNEETPAALMRRLPAKGEFKVDEIILRDTEVLLVMQPGIATRVIERELQECGYRVTTVANSFKALEFAARTFPDLMIISAVMPDLEGIDLAIGLKAMPATRNISTAVITSLDEDDPKLAHLPATVPIIHKSSSFGDDLAQALQDQFLL